MNNKAMPFLVGPMPNPSLAAVVASGRASPLSEPVRYVLLLLGIVAGIVILGGYRRMTDDDLPQYLIDLAHGAAGPTNPHQGFKFEGLLADAGLYLTGLIGLGPGATALAFWAAGLAAIAAALLLGLRNGSIGAVGLLYAVAFTRIVDTLAMWVGKTDPWLVAFVILSANRSRALSRIGIVMAAFVHPTIALLSTLGLLAVEACDDRKLRRLDLGLAVAATGAALLLFRMLFPDLQGRGGYLLQQFAYLGLRGLEDGLPSLAVNIVAPLAALLLVAGRRREHDRSMRLLLAAWLAGVAVLTSVFTLDHTRDAALITFAAALAWLRQGDLRPIDLRTGAAAGTVAALFAARVMLPHYDQDGPHSFRWPFLARWAEPRVARILDADAALCRDAPLRCVYHRNPAPEVRTPTL